MQRLLIVTLAAAAWGCPADGPDDPMSDASDTSTAADAASMDMSTRPDTRRSDPDMGVPLPAIEYCQLQAQSPAMATAGEASDGLYALVFHNGVTNGAGAGAGLEGELGWGADATYADFTYTPMSYNVDLDGLEPGDLANDEYGAALTIPTGGTYRYAARFRLIGAASWTYCDLDGSENGVSDDQLGSIEVRDAPDRTAVDACNLQFPHIVENGEVGTARQFFGRVTEVGLTGGDTGSVDVLAQLFVGPVGADPRADFGAFEAIRADFIAGGLDVGPDEAEYVAMYAPASAGELAFGYRFSLDDGATWTFCGLQDDTDPSGEFTPTRLGALTAANTPDTIDFCHVWQDELTDDAAAANLPTLTVEVFEAPLTVENAGANAAQLEVQSAAIPRELNPAFSAATWTDLAYKDLRAGFPSNYEYEGVAYTAANHPTPGTYAVVARVRIAGTNTWTYCDTDETAPEFRVNAATSLTVTP